MPHRIQFDTQDKAALTTLDPEFIISTDGAAASVTGTMSVEIIRPADDRLKLTLQFPNGEEFAILLSRDQTLRHLNIKVG
jgi:hypothetical protein